MLCKQASELLLPAALEEKAVTAKVPQPGVMARMNKLGAAVRENFQVASQRYSEAKSRVSELIVPESLLLTIGQLQAFITQHGSTASQAAKLGKKKRTAKEASISPRSTPESPAPKSIRTPRSKSGKSG